MSNWLPAAFTQPTNDIEEIGITHKQLNLSIEFEALLCSGDKLTGYGLINGIDNINHTVYI